MKKQIKTCYFSYLSFRFFHGKCKQHKIFMLSNIKQTLLSLVSSFFFALCVFYFSPWTKRKTIYNFPICFPCLEFQLNKFHNNNSKHQKRLASERYKKKEKRRKKTLTASNFRWMTLSFRMQFIANILWMIIVKANYKLSFSSETWLGSSRLNSIWFTEGERTTLKES